MAKKPQARHSQTKNAEIEAWEINKDVVKGQIIRIWRSGTDTSADQGSETERDANIGTATTSWGVAVRDGKAGEVISVQTSGVALVKTSLTAGAPVGANGVVIRKGIRVMADAAGFGAFLPAQKWYLGYAEQDAVPGEYASVKINPGYL